MTKIIAIIGRPNTGKSTLFNRILRRRQAVVAEESGVTRDRHYAEGEWSGRKFTLIDTGGMVEKPDFMEDQIRVQAQIAIEEADIIIFLADVKAGVMPDDEAIAGILRRSDKKVVLAVNKADDDSWERQVYEFHRLGLGEPQPVSAQVGRGLGELLDYALEGIPETEVESADDSLKIAVIGRPNVGKSSLVNAFLNEERHIVTPVPGTTRDSIDSKIKFYGTDITLIDTAGLRRASKVKEAVEFFCNLRTSRALERADIALILFEAGENLTKQDTRIINQAVDLGKGVILLANKWDLVEKETGTFEDYKKEVEYRLGHLKYIPLLTISALTKQRIHRALQLALEIQQNCFRRISTSDLNDYLLPIVKNTPPPSMENKYVKIKYCSQVSVQPTEFAFHCNFPEAVAEQYKRFLERKIREKFDFTGLPVRLKFLKK